MRAAPVALLTTLVLAGTATAGTASATATQTPRIAPAYSSTLYGSRDWLRSARRAVFTTRVSLDIARSWHRAGGIRRRDIARVRCTHTVTRYDWQATCRIGLTRYAAASFVARERGRGTVAYR